VIHFQIPGLLEGQEALVDPAFLVTLCNSCRYPPAVLADRALPLVQQDLLDLDSHSREHLLGQGYQLVPPVRCFQEVRQVLQLLQCSLEIQLRPPMIQGHLVDLVPLGGLEVQQHLQHP